MGSDQLAKRLHAEVGERQDAVFVETVDQVTTSSTSISTPSPGQTHAYSEVADEAGMAREGMKWPVGLGCATEAESRAWEVLMRAFVAADFAKLRDPAELGSVFNNDPPRFSMLTPNASLRAWLSFADDNNPHAAEALEGARKLSHRTSDAVAWLSHPNSNADRAFLMRHLLQLDLEATPELCRAGLARVEDEFESAYRPTPKVRTWRNPSVGPPADEIRRFPAAELRIPTLSRRAVPTPIG